MHDLVQQAPGSMDEEDDRDPMSKPTILTSTRHTRSWFLPLSTVRFFPQLIGALLYYSFYFWLVVNQTAMLRSVLGFLVDGTTLDSQVHACV